MTRRKLSRLRRTYNAQRRSRFPSDRDSSWNEILDADALSWAIEVVRKLPTYRDSRGFWYYGMPSGYGDLPRYVGPCGGTCSRNAAFPRDPDRTANPARFCETRPETPRKPRSRIAPRATVSTMGLRARPLAERLLEKVSVNPITGCHEWTAARSASGYGKIYVLGRPRTNRVVPAHRVAYELWVGPIPEGLQLDHLCRNRACVNPAHLEPVTQRVNLLRGMSPAADNARKTQCPRGHVYNGANTYRRNGDRKCRACHREKELNRYRAARGGVVAVWGRNKTHCVRGHAFDVANTRWRGPKRECRACGRLKQRLLRQRRAAA